ncbi:DUF72 domain-containing protein [Mucilaginibacter sp. ZT4R22]|uniref:DUF72 domain-containing protein n=1 Tax=Mucilaginibacter pankratovii TaxID=2772110 RepID=A0ABR7WR56_9SPHI|nr:DUF72 domain-containing protein [Mucilaginibacter pankratovii]MBD1363829.1 DUF72 domain-containing protein [Mucilaginibacter pankratovii]
MENEGKYYSGTSGLVLPVPNKLSYPPNYQDKSRLCYYASLQNSIEVNSSFYKVPMAATVQKWAADVPENFCFTYKLWRNVTHNKGLIYNPEDITRFMQVIAQAGDKKGSLLVQFPASITIANRPQMEMLLQDIYNANTDGWHIAIEFRSKTWYRDDIYSLLRGYQMAIVLHDMPKSAPPMLEQDVPFVYLRFHGPGGSYRGSYSDEIISEYAGYIAEWLEEDKTVYTYFNNTMGDALNNLITLNEYVTAMR